MRSSSNYYSALVLIRHDICKIFLRYLENSDKFLKIYSLDYYYFLFFFVTRTILHLNVQKYYPLTGLPCINLLRVPISIYFVSL